MAEGFGERLRTAREAKGLSQADLATRTGLQPSAISHFETGRRTPSFENLRRLADALSLSIDHLLGREGESKAAGPGVQRLFRNLEGMSQRDQELVQRFAAMLRHKDSKRGK